MKSALVMAKGSILAARLEALLSVQFLPKYR